MERELIILDTHTIQEHQGIKVIKMWIKGMHPDLGHITRGWTGWETVVEVKLVKYMRYFLVRENPLL
jgi:hypothetical protein